MGTGNAQNIAFTEDFDGNPLAVVNSSIPETHGADSANVSGYAPQFVDWNGDGYVDLFVGTNEAHIYYFENQKDGTWAMADQETSPFGLYDGPGNEHPVFLDNDGDGDLDAFVGNKDGDLLYFENDGNGNLTLADGPFDDIDFGGNQLAPDFQEGATI